MLRAAAFLLVVACATPALARPASVEFAPRGDVPPAAMQRLEREAADACARVNSWLGIDTPNGKPAEAVIKRWYQGALSR